MTDPVQRRLWFYHYLNEALKLPEARDNRQQAEAWARSMSLIADQLQGPYELRPSDL